MENRVLYMIGAVLVTAALAYGAFLLGIPAVWIGIGVVLILGLSIMGSAKKAKKRPE